MTNPTADKLMQAAADLVVEEGWGSVTTRGVAERAGVRPGLVHYHFETVEHLKRAAVTTRFERELERVVGNLEEHTPREIIQSAAAWIAGMGEGDSLSLLLIESLPPAARDQSMRVDFSAMLGRFRDRLADRIRSCHPAPAAPPEALAMLVAAVLDGLALHVLAQPDLDVGAAVHPLLELLGPEHDQKGTPS